MRAFVDEIRLAFRLTFVEGLRELRRTGRSHPGFLIDHHLRKGFIVAGAIVLLGLIFTVARIVTTRSFAPYFSIFVPFTILANVVWFAIAARSRSKDQA